VWLQSGVTLGGLLATVFLSVVSGLLVPWRTNRAQVKQANDSADLWHQAYEKQAARADLAAAQTERLLTGMATQEALLRALQAQPGKGPG